MTKENNKTTKLSKNVQAIIASVEKLTVLELAELVEALEDKFGVSATPAVASPVSLGQAPEGTGAKQEEKSEYDVVLKSTGDKKIAVIKAVRTFKQDLGLTDAKKLVESAPITVLEKAKKEDAQEAKKKLEEAGATVELK